MWLHKAVPLRCAQLWGGGQQGGSHDHNNDDRYMTPLGPFYLQLRSAKKIRAKNLKQTYPGQQPSVSLPGGLVGTGSLEENRRIYLPFPSPVNLVCWPGAEVYPGRGGSASSDPLRTSSLTPPAAPHSPPPAKTQTQIQCQAYVAEPSEIQGNHQNYFVSKKPCCRLRSALRNLPNAWWKTLNAKEIEGLIAISFNWSTERVVSRNNFHLADSCTCDV